MLRPAALHSACTNLCYTLDSTINTLDCTINYNVACVFALFTNCADNCRSHPVQIRYMLYKKQADALLTIKSPKDMGGFNSDEFRRANPYGRVPLLKLPNGSVLYESEVGKGVR